MENDKCNRNVEPVVSFDKLSDAASIQPKMGSTQVDLKVTIPILKSNGSNNSVNMLSSQSGGETVKNSSQASLLKKKVSFPEDVIVGYHEPRIPWNNVSECSTDDLITAYKTSCSKHDVKPLPKLLQQLHAVANFHERNETLTFRGESLNIRHCEALEEVLRRVQYRTIDLEASHLDEESAIAMFDMIEYYHSATRLNISYNKIGLRGWQACSRMLKKTHCVEHLDARSCALTEQMVPIFGRALRLGSVLRVLHLENSIMSGRSLMILVAAIKMNEILEDLFLADNKLMPSDGIQLGNLLKFNHKLRLLDVRNNHLGDVGTTHLSEGLYEQILDTGLHTLVLWNNQVTCQSMHALSRALKNNKNLETLNLGHNNITNEGIHRLKEGLLQNKSLMRIGLQAAKVYCEGAVALAECVAESLILVRLDLRENDIKTAGLMALSLALKVNDSVHRIDIDQNSKRESGIKDYADQQRRLLQDIGTYSQRNREAAMRREQEEKQKKLEEELQAALNECEPATEELKEQDGEQDEDIFSEQQQPSEELPTQSSLPGSSPDPYEETEDDPSITSAGQELLTAEQLQMRLPLNLPLFSRSQSLDSPAEPPRKDEEESGESSSAQEDLGEALENTSLEDSPIPVEFPPSPMVSSEGKTIHADTVSCPAIPLLMEPAPSVEIPGLKPEQVKEEEEQQEGNREATDGEEIRVQPDELQLSAANVPQSLELQASSGISTSGNDSLSPTGSDNEAPGHLKPSPTPSPTRSPNSRRKFTISRVPEHSSGSESAHNPVSSSESAINTSVKNEDNSEMSSVPDETNVSFTCDNNMASPQAITDHQQDNSNVNKVTEFVESLTNDVMNIAYSSATEKEETEKSVKGYDSTEINDNLNPSEKVNDRTDREEIDDINQNRGASSDSDTCTVVSGVNVSDSGDCAMDNSNQTEVNGCLNELEAKESKVKDIASVEHSGEMKVVTDSVNINGINVSVDDFLEHPDCTESGNKDKELNEELLASAEDFEKELDDMLANVQTELAFKPPEGVQAENST